MIDEAKPRATIKEFLIDMCKDFVAMPGERPAIIEGYARLLELREQSLIKKAKEAK